MAAKYFALLVLGALGAEAANMPGAGASQELANASTESGQSIEPRYGAVKMPEAPPASATSTETLELIGNSVSNANIYELANLLQRGQYFIRAEMKDAREKISRMVIEKISDESFQAAIGKALETPDVFRYLVPALLHIAATLKCATARSLVFYEFFRDRQGIFARILSLSKNEMLLRILNEFLIEWCDRDRCVLYAVVSQLQGCTVQEATTFIKNLYPTALQRKYPEILWLLLEIPAFKSVGGHLIIPSFKQRPIPFDYEKRCFVSNKK